MKTMLISLTLMLATAAHAEELTIALQSVDAKGTGADIGSVIARENPYGVVFAPRLSGLAPGVHGFHVHENPSCGPKEKDGKQVAALAAGGHFDPKKTGRHAGPWGEGHLGDLPVLYVDAQGKAEHAVLAPRLKLADLKGRSLMVHAGGDNHADHPDPLGGGAARVACGVIR